MLHILSKQTFSSSRCRSSEVWIKYSLESRLWENSHPSSTIFCLKRNPRVSNCYPVQVRSHTDFMKREALQRYGNPPYKVGSKVTRFNSQSSPQRYGPVVNKYIQNINIQA